MGKQAKYARLHTAKAKQSKQEQPNPHASQSSERLKLPPPETVQTSLDLNERHLREILGENDSILCRRFQLGTGPKRAVLLVSITGITDKKTVNEGVISPIMKAELPTDGTNVLTFMRESVLAVMDIGDSDEFSFIVGLVLQGNVAVFVEGETRALLIPAGAWKSRAIDQPVSETVIRGPRDSFVEDLNINLSLLRKRIHHPQLRLETSIVGTMTQTKVVMVYVEGIVDEAVVEEVRKRISKIKVDMVIESGYIEQHIEDAPFSIFPTIANTEKPDITAARILEGRVAIFVDGTPIVLTLPDLLISHFQVSEDYYARPFYSSLVRLLRILSFLTTTMLPGLFVAVQYYHPVLIPYSLLVSLSKSREGVPFQLYIEVILMILVFEVIREAGVRMPRPIGQAVSIVGAIILGQSAVEAGLVGIPVVVVVAFAGISTFLINSLAEPISILRLLFALAGSTLGIYGILLLGMIVVTHLATLRSFGVPYASPLFPLKWGDWKDAIFRFPLKSLWHRPQTLNPENYRRIKQGGESNGKKQKKE
jgi:spore germination protein KA